eukprot:CAMPEP_0173397042 /NCGR_PEP_ID=MMETSP1356-20130122/37215_1 /TAXON_ID=77927 ORGANISM="Hemiselmis virescens, Strain PCC157" /NCGR_SAMPLE_ID=MMETSP1356 /ASSEMBLY_ACC=CAM_ASM_000847 /LENGTH=458 /DNA_ID=CAMNT_0014356207 /DNA_START=44 /DNA_END=1416 /DNA_ORIENTATION=+
MLLRTPIAVVCAISVLANPSDGALRTGSSPPARSSLSLLPKHHSSPPPSNDRLGIFPPSPGSASASSAGGAGGTSGSDLIAAVAAFGLRESKRPRRASSSTFSSDSWEIPIKHVGASSGETYKPLASTDTAAAPASGRSGSSDSGASSGAESESWGNLDVSTCFAFCNRKLIECHDAAAEGRTELEMREREMKKECGSGMHQQAEKLRQVLNKTEASHAAERDLLQTALEESKRTLRVHNHFLSALMVRAIYADTSRESFRKELEQLKAKKTSQWSQQHAECDHIACDDDALEAAEEAEMDDAFAKKHAVSIKKHAVSVNKDVVSVKKEAVSVKKDAVSLRYGHVGGEEAERVSVTAVKEELGREVEALKAELQSARRDAREASKRLKRVQREMDAATRSATPHVPPVKTPSNSNSTAALADPAVIDSLHTMLHRMASRVHDAPWHTPSSARSLSKLR